MKFKVLWRREFFYFPLFVTFLNPKILAFPFLRKIAQHGEWNVKNLSSEKRRRFIIDKLRKLYMNGIDYPEIFSRPKPIENSRPCLVFQTDMFYRKQLLGFTVCWLLTEETEHNKSSSIFNSPSRPMKETVSRGRRTTCKCAKQRGKIHNPKQVNL